MRIKLKRLALLNFKGVRALDITMDQVTNIYGDNGTGKTTIFDAFLWLLFGKDSTDRKDFEIKTLDSQNKPFQKMEHEVVGEFEADGEELVLRKIYKEKWTAKRGSSSKEFTGHENIYFWNEVPLKLEDFQQKIGALMNESVFKLITNTGYFNALKWQDRRNALIQLAGHIPDCEVFDQIITLANKGQFIALTNALNAKKSLKEFRDEIFAKKKKIKDEKDLLPSRIEEGKRLLPEIKDYTALEAQLATQKSSLTHTEALLMNKSQAQTERQNDITKLINKKSDLNRQLQDIEFKTKNKVRDAKQSREQEIIDSKRQLRTKQDDRARISRDILQIEKDIAAIKQQQDTLRTQYNTINADKLEFKEGEFCCPACKREFAEEDITDKKAELTSNFNTDKSKRLTDNQSHGKALGLRITELSTKLEALTQRDTTLQTEITQLSTAIHSLEETHNTLSQDEAQQVISELASDETSKSIKLEMEKLDEQINIPAPEDDNKAELLEQKRAITTAIDELNKELSTKEQRRKILARIAELENQEESMAQDLATLEGAEFSIELFTKAKMDMIESRINGKFSLVKFKMFEDQINGGQQETCQTLIDGVPYSDANTASKVNAGLDIIRALSKHYGVWAPIFIDNRESVVRIPDSDSQIINLIVYEGSELSIGAPRVNDALAKQRELFTA